MDAETRRTYVGYRVAKARDDLATARDLLGLGRWRGAVNRAYYAIFHIASAALLWNEVERQKHSAVQAAFNQHLVKPGGVETQYARIYKDAREWREEQDYKDTARPLEEPIATQIVADAERFLSRLEQYLRVQGAIE